MLRELRISHLGVIDEATLDCGPGLTVISGETGAGKTMIVTSLKVLLGAPFSASLVRRGSDRALVEARFEPVPEALAEAVADLGGVLDDGDLLVTRQVGTSARTRTMLGGAQVPAVRGAEVVDALVTVHGQSEQVRLVGADRQREVLDRFAGEPLAGLLTDYRAAWVARRDAAATLSRLRGEAQARAREASLLSFGLSEIAAADPQPGEDAALAAEAQRLYAVDDLRLRASEAAAALSGDDDPETPAVLALLARARKALEQASVSDQLAAGLASRVTEASYLLTDIAADVASYLADLDADPARLEWVTGRRAELAGLTRKYGSTVDDVLSWAQQAAATLANLTGADEQIDQLTVAVSALTQQLDTLAVAITARRTAAAHRLGKLVEDELQALAMPHARLVVQVSPLPELGAHGADRVALLFSANPGSAPAPLGDIASGGELSRVRLAIEVVLADDSAGHTFVFDEVDAGVGGAVASEVGWRLARLAKRSQVLVVTHLAQVAAFADTHYVVTKTDDGQVTTSGVRTVQGDEALAELARMMSGLDDTVTAVAHARDLSDGARRRIDIG